MSNYYVNQRFWTSVLMAGLVACGSNAGETGLSSLVRMEDEPPGANCPSGGTAILTGIDTDGDGELADTEVLDTDYVCNGLESLVLVEPEPEGTNCHAGGTAVHSGLDANGNGTLEPDEIESTEYVCNGEPGEGLNSLVHVEPETAGTNCPAGGYALHFGLDQNSDGLLQPAEVDTTVYVCHGAAGHNSLIRQEDELPGTQCPAGGKAVLSGLDADDNGYLDASEVQSTSYVCNGEAGEAGHNSLFGLVLEAAGTNCPAGGYLVQVGVDVNDNAALDATEVYSSQYLCNGAAGADGLSSLVDVTAEPTGTNCPEGGQQIDTGADSDQDGLLDDPEVVYVQYLCTPSLVKMSAGWDHICGVFTDGSARCWGAFFASMNYAFSGHTRSVENLPASVDVTGGDGHACSVIWSGKVYCWGDNTFGQLGRAAGSSVLPADSITSAVRVEAGSFHTCALLDDETVWCWGRNMEGQLGRGFNRQLGLTP